MIDQLTAEDFNALPERCIVLVVGDERIALDIVEVRTLAQHAPRDTAPFALTLRETGTRNVRSQGIFRFEHPVRGMLELFTVPIGVDSQGMCYEIVFN